MFPAMQLVSAATYVALPGPQLSPIGAGAEVKAIRIISSTCPEGEEAEFNRWYDEVHLPDILAIDGSISARRHALSGPGPEVVTEDGSTRTARYIAVYQFATADIPAQMERLAATMRDLTARGRISPSLQVVSRGNYVRA